MFYSIFYRGHLRARRPQSGTAYLDVSLFYSKPCSGGRDPKRRQKPREMPGTSPPHLQQLYLETVAGKDPFLKCGPCSRCSKCSEEMSSSLGNPEATVIMANHEPPLLPADVNESHPRKSWQTFCVFLVMLSGLCAPTIVPHLRLWLTRRHLRLSKVARDPYLPS